MAFINLKTSNKPEHKAWAKDRNKYPTGFCATISVPTQSQGHEGTSPTSHSGKPMRVCTDYLHCPCSCHYDIDKMYEMIGQERPLPEQSPAYISHVRAQVAEFDMPSWRDAAYDAPLSSAGGTDTPPTDEDAPMVPSRPALAGLSTDPNHGTVAPRFVPTPTGRRARGQLEYDVLTVCDEYAHDVYDWDHCTPKLVAERIAIMNQEPELPSTGAINAVWDRWEKLGFAKQEKKPSRFIAFVMDGSPQTLEMLKRRAKGAKKLAAAEAKRGMLRPRR
jgi:hypothetical protein